MKKPSLRRQYAHKSLIKKLQIRFIREALCAEPEGVRNLYSGRIILWGLYSEWPKYWLLALTLLSGDLMDVCREIPLSLIVLEAAYTPLSFPQRLLSGCWGKSSQ